MNVKRYIAEDVPRAMEKIREELGRDAFILNTRHIRRPGVRGLLQKKLVEVVAAYEPPDTSAGSVSLPEDALAAVSAVAAQRAVAAEPTPERRAPVSRPFETAPRPPASTLPRRASEAAAPVSAVATLTSTPTAAPLSATAQPSRIPTSFNTFAAGAYGPMRSEPPKANFGAAPTATMTESRGSDLPSVKTAPSPGLPVASAVSAPPETPADSGRMEALENKLDTLSSAVNALVSKMNMGAKGTPNGYTPEVEALVLSLLENEVHEEFAHKIGKEVMDIVLRKNENAQDVMESILKQYLGEITPIKLKRFKRTVVIFLGPTGVGKTTSLAKLAAIFALNHHAKVGIITSDTYRIAAVDQLKTYAEILEVPLTVIYSPEDVAEALKDHIERDIVFIDTAGKSPLDPTLEPEILTLLKGSEADEVHLVLSSTTSFTGCLNILNTYSFLRDYKLLFTKMDETPTWGMLLNLKFLTDRSLSYMAFGQTVPDDIEVFNVQKVIRRLMGRESE